MNDITTQAHIYERPFYISGPITDLQKTNQYIKDLRLGEDLGADFEMYMQENTVYDLTWEFQNQSNGVVRLITTQPLTSEQEMITQSFVQYQQTGPLGSRLLRDGFMETKSYQDPFLDRTDRLSYIGPAVSVTPLLTEQDLEFAEQMTLDMFGI